MNIQESLKFKIRALLSTVMLGLVAGGIAALFMESAFRFLAGIFGAGENTQPSEIGGALGWIVLVRNAVAETNSRYPFLGYATDWLAFAHFVIAAAFLAPFVNPARHSWIITWGMLVCVAVFPMAFIAGHLRGIPFFWQLFSSSFGALAFIPLWLCRRYAKSLEQNSGF